MDRRHCAVLSLTLFALAGTLAAQGPPATPAVSATPWVQASPPPGPATTPTPTPRPAETTPTPKPPSPPKAPKPPQPPKAPKPPKEAPPPPAATPTPDELARQMMQRRADEQRGADTPQAVPSREPVRLDQLSPDERAAYQRNLPLWRQLPADERDALRRRADERARNDLDQAYQDSGLNLDHDQREVFDLRYRQERHKLERELQEKITAERNRRLAEIGARLKQEFANKPTPASTVNADALKPPGTR